MGKEHVATLDDLALFEYKDLRDFGLNALLAKKITVELQQESAPTKKNKRKKREEEEPLYSKDINKYFATKKTKERGLATSISRALTKQLSGTFNSQPPKTQAELILSFTQSLDSKVDDLSWEKLKSTKFKDDEWAAKDYLITKLLTRTMYNATSNSNNKNKK